MEFLIAAIAYLQHPHAKK